MSDHVQQLVGRGKSLIDQLLRLAQTRLEMLSVELQQEKLAIGKQAQLLAIMVVCALLAGMTLIVWIALAFPPEMRLVALGIIFAAFVIGMLVCWIVLTRQVKRDPLFSRVVNQLHLDRAALNPEPPDQDPSP